MTTTSCGKASVAEDLSEAGIVRSKVVDSGGVRERGMRAQPLAFVRVIGGWSVDTIEAIGAGLAQRARLIMYNYATHKRPELKAWLAAKPRVMCTSPLPRGRG